jgi:hypothetical protein
MQTPVTTRRWLIIASAVVGISMVNMTCGGEVSDFPDEDGGAQDGGTLGPDGGPLDPLCTGVVCTPGFSCVNGLCEMDEPTSGIAGP